MRELPSAVSKVYAIGEMDNWIVSIHWAEGPFAPRRKLYSYSVRLVFKKKSYASAAAIWMIDEEGVVKYESGYVEVRISHKSGQPDGTFIDTYMDLPYRLSTQKELLMYLTGETSREEMKELIEKRWIKPEEVCVDKSNCPGCSICSKAHKGRKHGVAADKSGGRRRS